MKHRRNHPYPVRVSLIASFLLIVALSAYYVLSDHWWSAWAFWSVWTAYMLFFGWSYIRPVPFHDRSDRPDRKNVCDCPRCERYRRRLDRDTP